LVQPNLNTISRNGTTVRLEPKVMAVLVCLSQRAGDPVGKEELLQSVWADTFVSDDVLSRSISELRRVFEDDARQPTFIQTIPKRGYRLVAPVEQVDETHPEAVTTSVRTSSLEPSARAGYRWKASAVGGVLTIVLLLVAANAGGVRERLFPRNAPPIKSLAVLPLLNLSGDPGQEYFADGMTEELITELSRISGMKVISRTSVMRYKNSSKSLPEIARELHVDGIVEGSVMRSGDRVRITAQLINAHTDSNQWAETFDHDERDVLALQQSVATSIAATIKSKTLPGSTSQLKSAHQVNLKAHEAFLRGWYESDIGGTLSNQKGMRQASAEHYRRAIEYFKEAIREDSNFAPPYLGLAMADVPIEETEAAAKKALEIDDGLSDGHLILGAIELVRDRNWQDAERELRRAIELNPSNAAAHKGYGYLLDAEGRLDEGMREYERAQEVDPGKDHLAGALYSRRQFDSLIDLERASLAKDPDPGRSAYDSAVTHKTLMVAYARTGRQKESIEEFRLALLAYGYDALAEDLRRGYARGGYREALREWLVGVQKEKPEFPFHWIAAFAHVELGEQDAAFAWLPKMEPDYDVVAWQDANVFPNLVTLRIEPMWDPLHSDPRFEQLVQKVGFPK
jgi:TolB-like protein/DNA-binding winged helix-turn-helix (wHTH) protein